MNHKIPHAFKTRSVFALSLLAWVVLLYSVLLGQFHWVAGDNILNKITPGWFGISFFKPFAALSLCLFKNTFHLPCLFCGLTRSFILIGQGHWQESLQYHLLGIPLYGFALFLASFGLLLPGFTSRIIALFQSKYALMLLFLIFSTCWLWKLGQSPQFW
jgi:hypothetical protein